MMNDEERKAYRAGFEDGLDFFGKKNPMPQVATRQGTATAFPSDYEPPVVGCMKCGALIDQCRSPTCPGGKKQLLTENT